MTRERQRPERRNRECVVYIVVYIYVRERKAEKSRLTCAYDARETETWEAEQVMCRMYRRIYIYERAEGREVSFVMCI